MKRVALLLITLIFFSPSFLRAEEITLTLEQAVALALRDNRDILLKTQDVMKAKKKIAEAQSGLFPTLNFTGGWTDTRGYYSKDLGQTTTQTTLKQYLYKGGKIMNSIEQDKRKFEVSSALLYKTKLEVALNVQKAFYTLLLAGEFAGLNKSIVDNTREHLDFIKERYQNGQTSTSEILNLEASLSSVRQVYEESLNQIDSSLALLNNLLYLDKEVKIKPDAQFDYEPKELAFDDAFLEAMKRRPEITQYDAQARADKNAIEIAKADSRPNVYASWDYYSRSHLATGASRNWNDYNVIGLTFSWPIFDGWATRHKVEQAIIDLKETQLLKEKAVKDIVLELRNAYIALRNALVELDSAASDIKVYLDNLLSVKGKCSQGIASSLELSDADLKYKISLFNKKQAIYDYIIAKASFEKATGGL